jgi:hypothetical protein
MLAQSDPEDAVVQGIFDRLLVFQILGRTIRAAIGFFVLFASVWAGCCPASLAQELSDLKGTWIRTDSPTRADQPPIGAWIKIDGGPLVVLSWARPARIADAQGQHGANFVWRSDSFSCWYEITRGENTLTFRLARGDPPLVCLESSTFASVSPPADGRRHAEKIKDCDDLTAHPNDTRRPFGNPGVPSRKIEVARAIPACQSAIFARPLDTRIMFQLGRAFFKTGDAVSVAEAIRLFRKAAEAGDAMAMAALGVAHAGGHGVSADGPEAERWLRKSANGGNAAALGFLGHMYEHGLGVAKDEAEALRLYRKSADSGVAMAMGALGVMYRDGRGVPKDETEAARWFRKGADAGDEFSSAALKRLQR